MNRLNTIVITLAMMCLSLTAWPQAVQRDVNVGNFNSLVVQDVIDVTVVHDASRAGHATFTATKQVADCLIFSNNGKGRLKVEVIEDMLGTTPPPAITVYTDQLRMVENDNVATLTVRGCVDRDQLEAISTGNGTILIDEVKVKTLSLRCLTGKGNIKVAAGRCDELKARLLGNGNIDADAVVATTAECHATGNATMKCNIAGGELRIKGSGSSKIYYRGNPSRIVNRKFLGSMTAIKVDHP